MRNICNKNFIVIGALAVFIAGCSDKPKGPVAISETRPAGAVPIIPTNVTSADRLLPRVPELPTDHPPIGGEEGGQAAAPPGAGEGGAGLDWDVPAGWVVGAVRSMRLVTFNSGGVECYIAELGGMGGGAEANFNRWRGQLGQPPLAAGEFDALPKIRVLNQDAPLMDVVGTYRGMGDSEQANSKLLGTLASDGERTFFVKMVGPATEVEQQREAFLGLCASLRVR